MASPQNAIAGRSSKATISSARGLRFFSKALAGHQGVPSFHREASARMDSDSFFHSSGVMRATNSNSSSPSGLRTAASPSPREIPAYSSALEAWLTSIAL